MVRDGQFLADVVPWRGADVDAIPVLSAEGTGERIHAPMPTTPRPLLIHRRAAVPFSDGKFEKNVTETLFHDIYIYAPCIPYIPIYIYIVTYDERL